MCKKQLPAGAAGAHGPDRRRGAAGLPVGLAGDRGAGHATGHRSAETLRRWVRRAGVYGGTRPGVTS